MQRVTILALTLALAQSATSYGFGQSMAAPASTGPVYTVMPDSSLVALLPPPPMRTSATAHEELKLLHDLEKNSTPAQKAAALADSKESDIFVYRTVLGNNFSARALPLTAALSTQVRRDSEYWNGVLKNIYRRPRPYRDDTTLHPLCGADQAYSYPSGSAMAGYLEAMLLAEIVPEQREAIFVRADDFAHNRWVCGAHYPSDTNMAHQIAATLFGIMLANPAFEEKLATARAETRHQLGLPELPPNLH
jgi:acid phosphatase (class A)